MFPCIFACFRGAFKGVDPGVDPGWIRVDPRPKLWIRACEVFEKPLPGGGSAATSCPFYNVIKGNHRNAASASHPCSRILPALLPLSVDCVSCALVKCRASCYHIALDSAFFAEGLDPKLGQDGPVEPTAGLSAGTAGDSWPHFAYEHN